MLTGKNNICGSKTASALLPVLFAVFGVDSEPSIVDFDVFCMRRSAKLLAANDARCSCESRTAVLYLRLSANSQRVTARPLVLCRSIALRVRTLSKLVGLCWANWCLLREQKTGQLRSRIVAVRAKHGRWTTRRRQAKPSCEPRMRTDCSSFRQSHYSDTQWHTEVRHGEIASYRGCHQRLVVALYDSSGHPRTWWRQRKWRHGSQLHRQQ